MQALLDSSQQSFVRARAGNVRLLAPAGCGKTLCLLYRCKHLTQVDSKRRIRLLVVTFTVAAKQELQARLHEDPEFAGLSDRVEITTLNSWGWRRVRNVAFNPKLITSTSDYHFAMLNQLQTVWQNFPDVKRAIGGNKFRAPRPLMNVMDALKSLGFDHVRHTDYRRFTRHVDSLVAQNMGWRIIEQINELKKHDVISEKSIWSEVTDVEKKRLFDAFFLFWIEASDHMKSNATFTLEDQKYIAFLDEREKLENRNVLSGAARYDHILVDEFQDINPLDLALISTIARRNKATLTIAGDDDQAIFEWRGATPEYILEPQRYFGVPFVTYVLGVNYRSPKNIVGLSQELISNNRRRVSKTVRPASSKMAVVDVRKAHGLLDALEYVHSLVGDSVAQGGSPSRVAVIGRKRSQIIPYQVYFASKDMPFCAAEDLQIFLSDAFERLLNLLTIRTDSEVRQSSRKVSNDILQLCDLVKRYPLSRADKESVRRHLQQQAPRSLNDAVRTLAGYRGRLKGPNDDGKMSVAMADAVRKFLEADAVSDTLICLSGNFDGLQYDLGKAEDDVFFIDPPFLQLAEFASNYGDDYDRFVDDIERARERLVYIPPFEESSSENNANEIWRRPIHLMTALRAKGKEFNTVVLLDVVDGIWPSKYANTETQSEAERRVFYVAFTRAKERVVMLYSDRIGSQTAVVSPYIRELGISVSS